MCLLRAHGKDITPGPKCTAPRMSGVSYRRPARLDFRKEKRPVFAQTTDALSPRPEVPRDPHGT